MQRVDEESLLVRLIPLWTWGLVCLVAAYALLSLRWGIFHDAALMYYVGREVAGGAVTAVDLFEMNTPLVHWFHAGLYKLFGVSDLAWRSVDLAAIAGIAALGYHLIRPLAGRMAWYGVLAVVLLHLRAGDMHAGQRDVMLLIPVLAAGLLLVRRAEGHGGFRETLAAGFCLAVAVLLKPSAVVVGPLMVLALAATDSDLRRPRSFAELVLPLALGFLAPCLIVAAILQFQGALGEYLGLWTNYLVPVYGKERAPAEQMLSHLYLVGIPLIVLALVAFGLGVRGRPDTRAAMLAAIMAAGLASYVLQGKGWYYQTAAFQYSAVLAGTVLAAAICRRSASGTWLMAGAFTLILPLIFSDMVGRLTSDLVSLRAGAHSPSPFARDVMSDLDIHVPRDMPVQILDTTHGGIEALLRSGRRQPTRFIYDFQFYLGRETPYRNELRAEFLAALSAAGAHALVVTNQQWPDDPGFSRIDDPTPWPELHAVVKTRYVLVATTRTETKDGKQYRIYRSAP